MYCQQFFNFFNQRLFDFSLQLVNRPVLNRCTRLRACCFKQRETFAKRPYRFRGLGDVTRNTRPTRSGRERVVRLKNSTCLTSSGPGLGFAENHVTHTGLSGRACTCGARDRDLKIWARAKSNGHRLPSTK